ncbi:uncharacterized protein LOC143186006 [Calliopsis andreniformis]|uniref:uncharacterized protein LOC143186006 n=1 Tax=Calliopsis andreniformis TaxID=337506 RepID=UPI003FCEAB7B
MIVTGKGFRFFVVVALTLLIVTGTLSASTLSSQDRSQEKANVSNSIPEGMKIIRVPLHRILRYRSIDSGNGTINEHEGNAERKLGRNATTSEQTPSPTTDISVSVTKDAKKNYKKLKLAQIQSKSLKNKEHSGDQDLEKYVDKQSTKKKIVRRHVSHDTDQKRSAISNINQINGDRPNKYKNDDYYAQRRAIMQRFYERQKEIARRYENQVTTTTTARYVDRYNLGQMMKNKNLSSPFEVGKKIIYKPKDVLNVANRLDAGSRILSTVEPEILLRIPRTTPDTENYDMLDNSEYSDEELETAVATNGGSSTVQPNRNVALTNDNIRVWGKCQSNVLMYQHNLNINVHQASTTEINIQTQLEGSVCVNCIQVTSINPIDFNLSLIPLKNSVKLRISSTQNQQLSLVLKVFIANRIDNTCI